MTNLVAYPQMRKVVEYYTKSAFYGGEHILTIKGFRQSSSLKGNVIILGRTGTFIIMTFLISGC